VPKKNKYVNKSVIIDRICRKYNLASREDTTKIVYATVKVMEDALRNHEDIMLHNVGHFIVHRRLAHGNKHPVTKVRKILPLRMTVKFKLAPKLKRLMNAALTTPLSVPTTNNLGRINVKSNNQQ